MKLALAAIAMLIPMALQASLDIDRLLDAISAVESGHDDSAVNPRCGAVSRYQITPIVWRQWEPGVPFALCRGERAYAVARRHIEWLIEHAGNDPATIAAAWRWGLNGSRQGWPSDYPERVRNLYDLE